MKLFVIGKLGSVTHWLEYAMAAWQARGHETRLGVARNPMLHPAIERLLPVDRLARRIQQFEPDLILAIGAYHVPPALLEPIAALPSRAPLIGWVGDLFSEGARETAGLYDQIAYTDSGLIDLHTKLGFAPPAFYLPHAVNPVLTAPRQHRASMLFVANPTAHRRAVVEQMSGPVSLYGPGWSKAPKTPHRINAYRVKPRHLMGLYASHYAALNIRNEHNVLTGLNQRNFTPYLAGAAVVTDAQADLERCFEPGREVLVWRDVDELNAIHARIQAYPKFSAETGVRGQKRVLAEHTYEHRLAALLKRL